MSIGKIIVRIIQVYVALMIIKPGDQDLTITSIVLAAVAVAVIEVAFRQVQGRLRHGERNGTLYRAEDFPKVLAQALKRAQAEVQVFTHSIPADKVRETLGMVRGISDTEAGSPRDLSAG